MALKTALVVDDSKSARKMLQKLLTKKSLVTDTVENGEEAIEYLQGRESFPDVIFMDHMMPGMNGLETSKKISDTPEMNSIPIVMFTSKEDPDYMEVARSHGASAMLRKPLSPSELDEVIHYINELTEQAADAGTTAQSEEEQAMQTAAQLPEINYEEIETMARLAAETAARDVITSSLPDLLSKQIPALKQEIKQEIVAGLPEAEDTSGMRNDIRSLQEEIETLQGRLAAVVETMQAQQEDEGLSDEMKQQIMTTAETRAVVISSSTAETIATEVAEKVAVATLQEKQAENAEDVVLLTGAEYRSLKLMPVVGLSVALVALAIAVF